MSRVESNGEWRQTGASAGIVAAMMLGLRNSLEPRNDEEPPVILDRDGEGHLPDAIDVYLHPEVPEATLVVVRTWRDSF